MFLQLNISKETGDDWSSEPEMIIAFVRGVTIALQGSHGQREKLKSQGVCTFPVSSS